PGNIRLSIAALQVIEGARVDMSAKLISHPREPTAGQAIEIAGLFLSGVVDYSPCLLPRGQMALERNCIPEAIIQARRVCGVEGILSRVAIGLSCRIHERVAAEELRRDRVVVAGPQVLQARLGVGVLPREAER